MGAALVGHHLAVQLGHGLAVEPAAQHFVEVAARRPDTENMLLAALQLDVRGHKRHVWTDT